MTRDGPFGKFAPDSCYQWMRGLQMRVHHRPVAGFPLLLENGQLGIWDRLLHIIIGVQRKLFSALKDVQATRVCTLEPRKNKPAVLYLRARIDQAG